MDTEKISVFVPSSGWPQNNSGLWWAQTHPMIRSPRYNSRSSPLATSLIRTVRVLRLGSAETYANLSAEGDHVGHPVGPAFPMSSNSVHLMDLLSIASVPTETILLTGVDVDVDTSKAPLDIVRA